MKNSTTDQHSRGDRSAPRSHLSPLTNVRDFWPHEGQRCLSGYLIDQLDPYRYAGRIASDEEVKEGWSFNLLLFQERFQALRDVAERDKSSRAAALFGVIGELLMEALERTPAHEFPPADDRKRGPVSLGSGYVLTGIRARKGWSAGKGDPALRALLAAEVLIGGSPQNVVARVLNTAPDTLRQLPGGDIIALRKAQWTITPQAVNYHVWHFLDSIRDRLHEDLVIPALRETYKAREDASGGPHQEFTAREADVLNQVLQDDLLLEQISQLARGYFSDPWDQEDATERAIDRIVRKISLLTTAQDRIGYALTIARNSMADHWRKIRKRREDEATYGLDPEEISETD